MELYKIAACHYNICSTCSLRIYTTTVISCHGVDFQLLKFYKKDGKYSLFNNIPSRLALRYCPICAALIIHYRRLDWFLSANDLPISFGVDNKEDIGEYVKTFFGLL